MEHFDNPRKFYWTQLIQKIGPRKNKTIQKKSYIQIKKENIEKKISQQ